MKIEELSLASIKPYEKNPRKNDGAVDGVAESIKQFGFQQPIVVDKDNVIVAGHTRYKAAKKLGLKTVPCVRADELTKEQVKAYRILDNKLNELATWDFEALSEELKSFKFEFEKFQFAVPEFNFSFEADELADTSNFGRSALPTNETNVSTSAEESSGVSFESELPEELRGVDLEPDDLPKIKGPDETKMDRIIIVFPADRKTEVAEWLGIEKLNKVVYSFDELP